MIYLYESTAVMMYLHESMREVPIDNPAQAMTGVGRRGGESEQGQGRARSPDQSAEMRGVGHLELGGFEIHASKNKGGSFGRKRASTRVSRTRSSDARPVFTRRVVNR